MSYDDERYRFRTALRHLNSCDSAIERMLAHDPRAQLDGLELNAAFELIKRCGIILDRVFRNENNMSGMESDLFSFVFDADSSFMEQEIDLANKECVRLSELESSNLDDEYHQSRAIAEERVKRGIDWLNSRTDIGTWEPCIDRKTLKMHDPCNCVGGSIFGDVGDTPEGENGFKKLLAMLAKENLSAVELGFLSDKKCSSIILQEEWLRQVSY